MKVGMIAAAVIVVVVAFIVLLRIFVSRQVISEIEKYQNDIMGKQSAEIQNAYHEMRGWRHDYKNHMQVLKIHVENREWEHALKYIAQMNEDLSSVDNVIKTGNVMADAIVNSKVSMAKAKEISVDVTAKVPKQLPVSDVEFCVLSGNLMDNAIEACEKISSREERFIRIYIGLFKKQFYMSVTNATNQKIRVRKYYSLKGEGHGLGLYRMDRLVKKKSGYLNRKNEPGVFATEIMLPFVPAE